MLKGQHYGTCLENEFAPVYHLCLPDRVGLHGRQLLLPFLRFSHYAEQKDEFKMKPVTDIPSGQSAKNNSAQCFLA